MIHQEIFMPKTFHKKRQHETHYIRKHKKIYRDEETLDGRMTFNYQDFNLEFFHKTFIEHLAAAHKTNIES